MYELFPLIVGAVVGVLVRRIASVRWRALALVVGCALVGFAATVISGEALLDWDFLLVDIPLAFLGALGGLALASWLRRRAAATSAD